MKHRSLALAVGVAVAWAGCAHPSPRVGEVLGTKHTENIDKPDHTLFVNDHASHLRVEVVILPAAERSQEYYVPWRGTGVRLVKFEYRQVNVPDQIQVQTVSPTNQHSAVFRVVGDDFINGGAISAWHVSLWDGDKLLAERKSVLW
jgi:hypothetical protein